MKDKNPKYNKDFWIFKAPMVLKAQLDKVRIERVKKGKDVEMKSYKRLGLGIARHENLIQDLINAEMRDDE